MNNQELDEQVDNILERLGKGPYWNVYRATWNLTRGTRKHPHPYSSDISAAWYVLETLRDHFSNVVLCGDNGWGLSLGNIGESGEEWTAPINAETAPRAICLAFVMALSQPGEPKP